MKSPDSREVTNEITGFLYLWRSDKIVCIGRIFDVVDKISSDRINEK